jgi:hypothetical protein
MELACDEGCVAGVCPIPGDNPSRHAPVDEHNIPQHDNEHNEWPTSAEN